MNSFVKHFPDTVHDNNIKYLHAAHSKLQLPQGWHRSVAGASVSVANPKRTHTVKVDNTGVLTLDVLYKGNMKSTRFGPMKIEEAWSMAEQAIKSYVRMEQCKETSKAFS